jgi:K(+)-stimulated pyrophosphate-energized sodium pump
MPAEQSTTYRSTQSSTRTSPISFLKNRWLYISITAALVVAALIATLDMRLYAVSLICGVLGILLAVVFILKITRRPIQAANMQAVAGDIRTSANAYLNRQIRTVLLVTPFFAALLYFILGWQAAITSVFGVLTSLLAAYVGMSVSVRTNLQTADVAKEGKTSPFRVALFGGSVMGLCITGFSLVVLSILFSIFKTPESMIGFAFGGGLAALFAQIGGGIFTKSADVGADLVGKIEANIPEDDPRNAAVIADLVGDNVGDCAGRGADLFQTFSDDLVTGSIVAIAMISVYGPRAAFFPFLLQSAGLFASTAGIFASREWKPGMSPTTQFNIGLAVSSILSIGISLLLSQLLLNTWIVGIGATLGVLITTVASVSTRYYAGMDSRPVSDIAKASKRGAALNLITGLGYGLQSPVFPVIVLVAVIISIYTFSNGNLLALVGVNIGTDLLITYIMAADAFGPIVDNAAGIAGMSNESGNVITQLARLDSVGNTMKAITKAYAMISGTITAFVIFLTFYKSAGITSIDVTTPFNLGFLFVGVSLPFLVSSLVIGSTAKTAQLMVDEVRKQFNLNPKIMEGQAKPDYSHCVDIATRNALREMIFPSAISILVPIGVGYFFGMNALGAVLVGSVACSALFGPFFNNVGTAFDNAKKMIEDQTGMKGTPEHIAAVTGDTVGDPLKDVAGPSILIFMKLVGMTALLIVPLFK